MRHSALAAFHSGGKVVEGDETFIGRKALGVNDPEEAAKGIVGKRLTFDGLTKSLNQKHIRREAKHFLRWRQRRKVR